MNLLNNSDHSISLDKYDDSSDEFTDSTGLTHSSDNQKFSLLESYRKHNNLCKSGYYSCHRIKQTSFPETINSSVRNNAETTSISLTLISTNQRSTFSKNQSPLNTSSNQYAAIPRSPGKSSCLTNKNIFDCKLNNSSESTPLFAQAESNMDGRGIEIIVSDENDARVSTVHSGNRAMFRRVWMILLDNRVAGRPDSERALRPHPEDYRVLKRVLNIIFVTIGVALLIAVFVVIIYTYVVDEDDHRGEDNSRAYFHEKVQLPEERQSSTNQTSQDNPATSFAGSWDTPP